MPLTHRFSPRRDRKIDFDQSLPNQLFQREPNPSVPNNPVRQCPRFRVSIFARQHRLRPELQHGDFREHGGIGRMIRRWWAHAETALGDRSGVAAVEFAIIVPVLLALTMGVIDFGMYMNRFRVLLELLSYGVYLTC